MDSLTVAVREARLSLPLGLYLFAWAVLLATGAWAAMRMLKPQSESDATPRLFWMLSQLPKREALFAVVLLLWIDLAIVVTWKLAMGTSMGPHFDSWLLSLNGLTVTAGAVAVGHRLATKPDVITAQAQADAANCAPTGSTPDGAP